ncbi:hypothetical protein ABID22_003064 [Pontibacter aydingkolensis]|uniref:Uncharacterized protein n=1 Tax=Pontibacter aydingkolensis TaxID=1911536 RepID=A0ABS7CXW1_9BACT|nr:hypothetical protein [Pontibacter aydingkolensis]MBW7468679.1 hypothetical protein [Pontibacter aydingkolensis]
MKNKRTAIWEVTGYNLGKEIARKYFFNVYEYILYNDTKSFLQTLDYKKNLEANDKTYEEYLVFKYMLRLLKEKHPQKLTILNLLRANNCID